MQLLGSPGLETPGPSSCDRPNIFWPGLPSSCTWGYWLDNVNNHHCANWFPGQLWTSWSSLLSTYRPHVWLYRPRPLTDQLVHNYWFPLTTGFFSNFASHLCWAGSHQLKANHDQDESYFQNIVQMMAVRIRWWVEAWSGVRLTWLTKAWCSESVRHIKEMIWRKSTSRGHEKGV